MNKGFNIFYIYDEFLSDVVSVMPAPSKRVAILSFYNAKKTLIERGYNPKLLSLIEVCSVDHELMSITAASGDHDTRYICNLESVDKLYQDIVDDLVANETLPEC